MGGEAPRNAGFTLLELLIAVTIAMTSLVVVVQLSPSSKNSRRELEQTAIELASVMRGAQLAAAKSQSVSNFSFDLSKHQYWVKPARIHTLDPSTLIVVKSARFGTTESALRQIRFMPNGQNSGATIQLKKDNNTAEIAADWLTGAITVTMSP